MEVILFEEDTLCNMLNFLHVSEGFEIIKKLLVVKTKSFLVIGDEVKLKI